MATEAVMKGIENSWSLLNFAKSHGKMRIKEWEGKDGKFTSINFQNPETNQVTFVSFSSKMGELTPAEILAQKDSLQVVKLADTEENKGYILCRQGMADLGEEINLF